MEGTRGSDVINENGRQSGKGDTPLKHTSATYSGNGHTPLKHTSAKVVIQGLH